MGMVTQSATAHTGKTSDRAVGLHGWKLYSKKELELCYLIKMTTVTGRWEERNCKFQTGSNSERSQDLMLMKLNISAYEEGKHSSDT